MLVDGIRGCFTRGRPWEACRNLRPRLDKAIISIGEVRSSLGCKKQAILILRLVTHLCN